MASNSRGDLDSHSKLKLNSLFIQFVGDYLSKHPEVRSLVKCKLKGNLRLIIFIDIDKVTFIYCEYKEQEGKSGKPLKRDWKSRKDNFIKIMGQFENDGLLKNVGKGKNYDKEYLKYEVKSDEMWHLLMKNHSVQGKNVEKHPESSSDTGLGVSQPDDAFDMQNMGFRELSLDDEGLRDHLDKTGVVSQLPSDQIPLEIIPKQCHVTATSSFSIAAVDSNQILPREIYNVIFGNNGTCKARGYGHHILVGMDNIPRARRRGNHSVEGQVLNESGKVIGIFILEYVDDIANECVDTLFVEENPRSSGGSYPQNGPRSLKKKPSGDAGGYPGSYKKVKNYAIDMPLLMYFCDEMAKRGDGHVFNALAKLGILSAVLENRSEYFEDFAVTARDNGHIKLAEAIKTFSRELSCDSQIEALTLGKLHDAVQKERSSSKSDSVDSSDSDDSFDSDDNSSGYYGDCDSEENTGENGAETTEIEEGFMVKPETSRIKPLESMIKHEESMKEFAEPVRRRSISPYEETGQPYLPNTLTNEEKNDEVSIVPERDSIKTIKFPDANVRPFEDLADSKGDELSHYAVHEDDVDSLQLLPNHGANANSVNEFNYTLLHDAARKGHADVLRRLLNQGANVNTRNILGDTPLHMAVRGSHVDILQLLLNHGASVNTMDNIGDTPLHVAARGNHVDILQLLLNHGASVNTMNDVDYTPLHIAAQSGYVICIKLLLKSGANIKARNIFGETPYQVAVKNKHEESAECLRNAGNEKDETWSWRSLSKVVSRILDKIGASSFWGWDWEYQQMKKTLVVSVRSEGSTADLKVSECEITVCIPATNHWRNVQLHGSVGSWNVDLSRNPGFGKPYLLTLTNQKKNDEIKVSIVPERDFIKTRLLNCTFRSLTEFSLNGPNIEVVNSQYDYTLTGVSLQLNSVGNVRISSHPLQVKSLDINVTPPEGDLGSGSNVYVENGAVIKCRSLTTRGFNVFLDGTITGIPSYNHLNVQVISGNLYVSGSGILEQKVPTDNDTFCKQDAKTDSSSERNTTLEKNMIYLEFTNGNLTNFGNTGQYLFICDTWMLCEDSKHDTASTGCRGYILLQKESGDLSSSSEQKIANQTFLFFRRRIDTEIIGTGRNSRRATYDKDKVLKRGCLLEDVHVRLKRDNVEEHLKFVLHDSSKIKSHCLPSGNALESDMLRKAKIFIGGLNKSTFFTTVDDGSVRGVTFEPERLRFLRACSLNALYDRIFIRGSFNEKKSLVKVTNTSSVDGSIECAGPVEMFVAESFLQAEDGDNFVIRVTLPTIYEYDYLDIPSIEPCAIMNNDIINSKNDFVTIIPQRFKTFPDLNMRSQQNDDIIVCGGFNESCKLDLKASSDYAFLNQSMIRSRQYPITSDAHITYITMTRTSITLRKSVGAILGVLERRRVGMFSAGAENCKRKRAELSNSYSGRRSSAKFGDNVLRYNGKKRMHGKKKRTYQHRCTRQRAVTRRVEAKNQTETVGIIVDQCFSVPSKDDDSDDCDNGEINRKV